MLRIITVILCVVSANTLEAKGRFWAYTMKGTAYDAETKEPLKNSVIIIGRDTVTTDPMGFYSVTVAGVTCDRGGRMSINRCNRKAYGHLVVQRRGAGTAIRIKSHWKKYAFCNREEYDCPSFHRNLHVP